MIGIVDGFVTEKYGRGRYTREQVESIVHNLQRLARVPGPSDQDAPAVPMIFVELMLRQADVRITEDSGLGGLPTSSLELFEQHALDVLRNSSDREEAIESARLAARVCLAPDYIPKLQSRTEFDESGLSREAMDELLTSGLMMRLGTDADPRYRFTLDPVAEYLVATWEVIKARSNPGARAALSSLLDGLEKKPDDLRPKGLLNAISECLALEDAVLD